MSYKHSLDMINPSRKVEQYKRYIDEIGNRSLLAVRSKLDRGFNRLELLKEKLKLLSIDKVLERGFSLVTFNGEIIKECAQLNISDNVKIKFFRGNVKADVTDIEI
jgi:exodeoxyribonuclease VII large subunit